MAWRQGGLLRTATYLAPIGPQVQGWIEAAALEDPAKSAQLAIAVAEYFVPKLAMQ